MLKCKKNILNSKWHAKHPFSGQNTQHSSQKAFATVSFGYFSPTMTSWERRVETAGHQAYISNARTRKKGKKRRLFFHPKILRFATKFVTKIHQFSALHDISGITYTALQQKAACWTTDLKYRERRIRCIWRRNNSLKRPRWQATIGAKAVSVWRGEFCHFQKSSNLATFEFFKLGCYLHCHHLHCHPQLNSQFSSILKS